MRSKADREEQGVSQLEEGYVHKPCIQKHHQKDADKAGSRETVAWEEAAEIGRSQSYRAAQIMAKSL